MDVKLRYVFLLCFIFLLISCVSAESFTPKSGSFAFREVENVTVNGVNFTVPVEYKEISSNDTCKVFKHGKDKLKISVVKNGKIKKVKNSKKVKAEKTMLGSVEGYLVDRNGTSYTFSYKEANKLVVINSPDLALIIGVMGKD